MLKAGVGVHKLFVTVLELIQRFGVALPEQVQTIAKAFKVAHRLGAYHICCQHTLRAGSMAQQQGNAIRIGQPKVADAVLLHGHMGHIAKGIQQPGQVNAKNLAHAAGAGVAHKKVFVVFPRVPIRQVLANMVNIMHRLAECSHLLLDVLSFAPVKHGGRKKQQHAFFFRFCHVFLIAVSNQIQLGKYRQAVVQQLADNGRVGQGSGANKGGVRGFGGNGFSDAGVSGVDQAKVGGFRPAGFRRIDTRNADAGINAFGQAGTALAHAAQTNDQNFHREMLLLGLNSGTGPS